MCWKWLSQYMQFWFAFPAKKPSPKFPLELKAAEPRQEILLSIPNKFSLKLQVYPRRSGRVLQFQGKTYQYQGVRWQEKIEGATFSNKDVNTMSQ